MPAFRTNDAFLIVGLGNPGPKYAKTRHNVGFVCIDHLSAEHGIRLNQREHRARLGKGSLDGHPVHLIKPLTYMNDSGKAVGPIKRSHGIDPQHVIVIHDDLDLPFSRLRVRPGGSSGGHRGVQSIIDHLGSDAFVRIRIGIGRPNGQDPVDYVLEEFSQDEAPLLVPIAEQVTQILCVLMNQGVQEAMNQFNGQPSLVEQRQSLGD